jgi:hypothetical protein
MKKQEELLGSFYLGAEYDIDKGEYGEIPVHYDARDLTTHAVCVGMTGSGKTGLCIGLLEEAAMDKVPALIIDPKGDMTNLLLQFEDLSPDDFKPWINVDDAGRKGMTIDEYAEKMAATWDKGIASWGQDKARIKALKESVDYTIYTPGSDAGIPVNIMGSFAAPDIDFDSNAEMLRERIQGTVAALLGMINSKEDPVRSREGILLSTIFEHFWRQNEDLDLARLIQSIQSPPVRKLGVFDVDTFFPEKDRFDLAMEFNTLVASPQFQYWLTGEALDIEKMYYTADGQPRHSIFYIAHLSDSERMFFVTLLLNSLITWMRKQSGTTSLRSLLYFDEVFGYFPPTANPPSKKPLLTLLKQARAFGVGCVLVTQNPVDIDYKGLSNAGTWFIGKLQTERDKDRLLEGLENALAEAGNTAKVDYDRMISALDSRVFILHNVHEDQPVLYHTRWAMSYLRGPMTRPQVKRLMAEKKAGLGSTPKVAAAKASAGASSQPPSLDPGIEQGFLRVGKAQQMAEGELGEAAVKLEYYPEILGQAGVRYFDAKRKIDKVEELSFVADPPDDFGRIDWDGAHHIGDIQKKLDDKPAEAPGVTIKFGEVPENMNNASDWKDMEKAWSDYLYANKKLVLLEHPKLDISQAQGESKESFYMRLDQALKEERDQELDDMEAKFETKMERIEDRIRKEERELEEAKAEASSRKTAEWVNAAETLFSVFVKGRSRSFGTAATKRRMARRAKDKVHATMEDIEELQEDLMELEEDLREELDDIREKWEDARKEVIEKEVAPRRTDINIQHMSLVWHPYWEAASGRRVSAVL